MSLTSLTYLVFLFVCVCAYYILPRQAKELSLLAFSVFFYAYAMPKQLLIMMLYIWLAFAIGRGINKTTGGIRKFLLITGILASAGFLFFYKYLEFTLSIFGFEGIEFSLIVPIGISYITFQCIAYMVDLYKGKIEVITNPVSFFVYTLLFMKVTAGPIESPKHFFESLYSDKLPEWKEMLQGLMLMAMGFVKKMVVADALAPYIAKILDNPVDKDGLSVFLGAIMYSLQIYFDFSGYTDIARGSAQLFGISLTENFKHPYLSKNVREFWRRWHISLSDWLKNYIYIPLGGSRVGTIRRYFNVVMVFLVSGVWHGASITFIVWGLLHGIFQVVEMVFEPFMEKVREVLHIKKDGIVHSAVAGTSTFLLVTLAWIFFRASSIEQALTIVARIFTPWKNIVWVYENHLPDMKLLILIVVGVVFTWIAEFLAKDSKKINGKALLVAVVAIWLVFIALVFTSGTDAVNSFIYFDF